MSLDSIFGGRTRIIQPFGQTPWAQGAGRGMYVYGRSFCLPDGTHPGIDAIGPQGLGGPVYTPVDGVVINAGGTGVFTDSEMGNRPGTGELKIALDNGAQLILGHCRRIDVRKGQRVKAGQLVGTVGSNNGPHLHIEYRVPNRNCSAGYKIVDPDLALRGITVVPQPTDPVDPVMPGVPVDGGQIAWPQRPSVTSDGWLGLAQRLARAEYLMHWSDGPALDVVAQNLGAVMVRGTIVLIGGLLALKGGTAWR